MTDSETDGRDVDPDLVDAVADELDTGTYGNKVVLTRRQAAGLAAGTLSLGSILGFGTGSASAQSTGDESQGNVGTAARTQDVWVDQLLDANNTQFLNVDPGEPVNAGFGRNWVFDQINGGGPISDGDSTERQIWVIANGASDPAGADANDIIFEEQA